MDVAAARGKIKRRDLTDDDAAGDPFRSDRLKLTPGRRIVRAWKLMKRIRNRETALDAASLPSLFSCT